MSKFNDRIERDLHQIADQASPSSNAWQTIQHRMAEPDTTGTRDVIMLTAEDTEVETPNQGRRWLAIAASIAIVAIAAAALLRSGDDDTPIIADQPDEQSETTEAPTTEQPTTEQPTTEQPTTEQPTTTVAETTTTVADSEEAATLVPGLPLGAGAVTTDFLGVTMTFDSPSDAEVVYAQPGEFQLFYPQPVDAIRVFVAARIGGWYTKSESIDKFNREPGSIDPNDLELYFADSETIAERRPDTTISGRTVEVWDVQVDPDVEGTLIDECPRCLLTSSIAPFNPLTVQQENRIINQFLTFRLWFVRIEGMEPIAIWAAANVENPEWLDEFETTILPTIELGPDAPPLES
jgi:hypothetical protein